MIVRINKREALLQTSSNLLHKTARQEPLLNHTDATIRNEKLLKVNLSIHSLNVVFTALRSFQLIYVAFQYMYIYIYMNV